jgi:hypothetical protein
MTKSKTAFLASSRKLAQDRLFMWTFTFKELLGVKDTRKRWNRLLTAIKRTWPELQGIRVFEMHKRHGLHVHMVTNRWIYVNVARELAFLAGWGRIHVMRVPPERASYLAKYLSKERPECLKGWRLWAGFGDWDWTKVKDVVFDSLFCRIYRACKEAFSWTGNKNFRDRMRLVQWLEIRTIAEGWKECLGPGDKPYWMCCSGELLGDGKRVEAPF